MLGVSGTVGGIGGAEHGGVVDYRSRSTQTGLEMGDAPDNEGRRMCTENKDSTIVMYV